MAERVPLHRRAAIYLARLLAREPDGRRYSACPRLATLALVALQNPAHRAERHAVLRGLVEEVGETCNFTMQDGDEVVYLDRVEARWPLRLMLAPGLHVPLHCTASGKLFLALMPPSRHRSGACADLAHEPRQGAHACARAAPRGREVGPHALAYTRAKAARLLAVRTGV